MVEPVPAASSGATVPHTHPQRNGFVYLFGLYMLAKAFVLVFLGLWVDHLIRDPTGEMAKLNIAIRYIHMDPDGYWLRWLLRRLGHVHTHELKLISFASFFYAGLHLIEGVGLVGRYRWGEWMVVVSTFALVPFEGYEFYCSPNWVKTCVIVTNVAIGIYFIYRLRIHAEKALHLSLSTTPAAAPPPE